MNDNIYLRLLAEAIKSFVAKEREMAFYEGILYGANHVGMVYGPAAQPTWAKSEAQNYNWMREDELEKDGE